MPTNTRAGAALDRSCDPIPALHWAVDTYVCYSLRGRIALINIGHCAGSEIVAR